MAISATWDDGLAGAVGRDARRRAFRRARRHSRLVRWLRVLLPLGGTLVVLVFIVVTHFSLPLPIDLAGATLSVTRNSIIMENPHLTGFDQADRHYSVHADRAIQALATPEEVRLEAITASVTMAAQGTATITAAAGDYDHAGNTLRLHGGIVIDTSEGYGLTMDDADIDFGAGTMSSDNPVAIGYEDSRTTGSSLRVTGSGQSIVLEGDVRTVLMPPRRDAASQTSGE